jgi:hypothetical protein
MAYYSILKAMDEPELWHPWFKAKASWGPWRSFLSALFGLPLSDTDLELYRSCTGRSARPAIGFTEAWLVCGRRAGKSFILALIACYLAVFKDWKQYLSPGEVGTIKVIATDRRQARVIHRYCRAFLTKVPAINDEFVVKDTDDEIVLGNNITIEIQTASFRSVRGFTLIAALADEIAFWRSDEGAANPDAEIINALKPAMATIPGAFFLAASSPYAKRGELWNAYRQHWGDNDAEVLVWKAATRTMNPTVSERFIAKALEEDPAKNSAEYLAEFRSDIETFVSREVVEAAVVPGRYEVTFERGTRGYTAFVDPSGAAVDSMTLCIGHRDREGHVIIDALRERRPPFSPEAVVQEFADVIKSYHVRKVYGDRWGGEWPREAFKKHDISYIVSDKPKTALYTEFLPILNSGKVELLDIPRLISQLCSLERRTGRGTGRDSVDHPQGGHDDVANATAGCAVMAVSGPRPLNITPEMMDWAAAPSGNSWDRRGGVFAGGQFVKH